METVGQLTGGVAHDFNNLMTAVSGSHALLRQMIGDPRALRLLDTAERAVARRTKLTQQLLAFSRQHRLQPARANANHLIGQYRPDPVPVGVAQSDRQCARRNQPDRRHGHDHNAKRQARRELCQFARRDPAGRLCDDRGPRYRKRDVARDQRTGDRTLLHHQGTGSRERTWAQGAETQRARPHPLRQTFAIEAAFVAGVLGRAGRSHGADRCNSPPPAGAARTVAGLAPARSPFLIFRR
jgi:hypothetical protein